MTGLLTIGTLSAATGVPVETIRTWERRYGFPVPERKASGHRVYPVTTVPRLRRIAQALARGHRPAEVVRASDAALEALLAALPAPAIEGSAARDPVDLIASARAFDAVTLRRAFHADWAQLGPLAFLERRAAPFLESLGEGWAAGTLDVRHEHFGSACLGDFLRTVRQPLDERAAGPLVVLATLPGEQHGIGLQMAAVVFALRGWRPLVLGVDTPPDQITALTRDVTVRAVAVSIVRRRGGKEAGAHLTRLRRGLPRSVALLLGGSGAAAAAAPRLSAHVFESLDALDHWVVAQPA